MVSNNGSHLALANIRNTSGLNLFFPIVTRKNHSSEPISLMVLCTGIHFPMWGSARRRMPRLVKFPIGARISPTVPAVYIFSLGCDGVELSRCITRKRLLATPAKECPYRTKSIVNNKPAAADHQFHADISGHIVSAPLSKQKMRGTPSATTMGLRIRPSCLSLLLCQGDKGLFV